MSLNPSTLHMKIVSESQSLPATLSVEIKALPADPDRLWYSFINKQLTELTDEMFPNNVTNITSYQFENQKHLSSISLTNIETLSQWAFSNCGTELGENEYLTVNLPNVYQVATRSFNNTKIQTIKLPALRAVTSNCFRDCTSLVKADFPSVLAITTSAFANCTNLKTLILRRTDDIVSLSSNSVLSGTPIAAGTGYVYVPNALYLDYINDRVWSLFANQIRSIEDYNP